MSNHYKADHKHYQVYTIIIRRMKTLTGIPAHQYH